MASTVLITGASAGIGYSIAEFFSDSGWNVVATMRNPSCQAGQKLLSRKNVRVEALDVTKTLSISSAISAGIEAFGGIDVVINNAGYSLFGALELATEEQMQRQYSTNVFGPVRVMQAILPHFREKKSGTIINVTSVAGQVSIPFNSMYVGTKFALEGISECAAQELAPLGITVKIVQPGAVNTEFVSRGMVFTSNDKVKEPYYDMFFQKMMDTLKQFSTGGSSPEKIAKVVFEAATDKKKQVRYPAGDDAHSMLEARKTTSDEEWPAVIAEMLNVSA